MIDERTAREFLELSRIAVIGASPDHREFGNAVYRALRDHGIDVVAVHPAGEAVAGDRSFPTVGEVPDHLDGAIVMTGPAAVVDVVRQCADRGLRHLWLFQGLGGPGTATEEAIAECERLGLDVVPGACPLMFLEPAGLVHRIHRAARRANHSLVRVA